MYSVVLVAALTVGAEICDMVPTEYRSFNQTCTKSADCVNYNITGRIFQPWWLDDFTNMNSGLTCYDGWCTGRRKGGEKCTVDDNCISWICAAKPGTDYKICYDIDSLKQGFTCPITFSDMAAHDQRHHICAGNAYCSPVNFDVSAADSPTVCREWAGENDDCYVIWSEGTGSTPVRHTCDPELSQLYCQPLNSTWAPVVTSPTLLKDRINPGKCVKVPEHEEPGTCATIRGTAQRPHCKYDEFCSFNTTDPICKGRAENTDACATDADCEWGHACNTLNTGGYTCREMYKFQAGHDGLFDRTLFCDVGYVLDIATKKCVLDAYDNDCSLDADCNPTTTAADTLIAHFYPTTWTKGHMFCNKKVGTSAHNKCRDLFAPRHGCKQEMKELLKFTAQTLKEGRIKQTLSCIDGGCFNMRAIYKKFKWYGERIMCCGYRQEHDDVCLKHDGAVWSVQRGSWLGMDKDDDKGEVCPPTGMSAVTIAMLTLIFGVLFLVILFVLVKEYTYVAPPKIEDEDEKSGKSGTAPNEEENKLVGSPNEPKP
eukprot:TRINITY_DN1009_c0_g1_i2.p1 TRINITY_DN1009_c0_g1~~TRINITY_DN1009_c0_g1_i2.p1  ORF type:complete len:554 (+),score=177.01 TRINITY_DN1009_c0_g1_i2:42-1664(+)